MYLYLIWKFPGFVPFGANLTLFWALIWSPKFNLSPRLNCFPCSPISTQGCQIWVKTLWPFYFKKGLFLDGNFFWTKQVKFWQFFAIQMAIVQRVSTKPGSSVPVTGLSCDVRRALTHLAPHSPGTATLIPPWDWWTLWRHWGESSQGMC